MAEGARSVVFGSKLDVRHGQCLQVGRLRGAGGRGRWRGVELAGVRDCGSLMLDGETEGEYLGKVRVGVRRRALRD